MRGDECSAVRLICGERPTRRGDDTVDDTVCIRRASLLLLGLLGGAMAEERSVAGNWALVPCSDFVKVLQSLPSSGGSRLTPVDRASEFAATIGLDDSTALHGSYESLAADESLDVVYVATPSLRHVDDALMCHRPAELSCARSMAPSATEAKRVLDAAAAAQLFFLHAVWSRFFPAMSSCARAPLRSDWESHLCARVVWPKRRRRHVLCYPGDRSVLCAILALGL